MAHADMGHEQLDVFERISDILLVVQENRSSPFLCTRENEA